MMYGEWLNGKEYGVVLMKFEVVEKMFDFVGFKVDWDLCVVRVIEFLVGEGVFVLFLIWRFY